MIRLIDLFISLLGLLALSPFMLLIAIILRFTGEGEILYRQKRVGKNGQVFELYKFATMLKDSVHIGSGELTQYADKRVLPVGNLLRKTKLNELPQLFNVLIGEMSLVGPRPQTLGYFKMFPLSVQELISKVRPGVTGLGSVIFRDEEEIFRHSSDPKILDENVIMPYKGSLESWFVKNQSIILYLYLLFITIQVVVFPKIKIFCKPIGEIPVMPEELAKLIEVSRTPQSLLKE